LEFTEIILGYRLLYYQAHTRENYQKNDVSNPIGTALLFWGVKKALGLLRVSNPIGTALL